jgi:hypothetical protein
VKKPKHMNFVIMTAAASRDDGATHPIPESVKAKSAEANKALRFLQLRGFLAEIPTKDASKSWRKDDQGKHVMLTITERGRNALGPAPLPTPDSTKSKAKRNISASKVRKGTKLDLLIGLLKRKTGATIAEAVKATGWQPHSVRGAMSGTLKKKRGLMVESAPGAKRGRVYRITGGN